LSHVIWRFGQPLWAMAGRAINEALAARPPDSAVRRLMPEPFFIMGSSQSWFARTGFLPTKMFPLVRAIEKTKSVS
jgi:hypothetical protein